MTTTIATAALSVRRPRSESPLTARLLLAAFAMTGGAALAADALPLRSVTLYRSGVGYFERTGPIEGGESITMPLDLSHLNDVLRSLVVLDPGGQSPPMVSYTSTEPLSRLLAGYQIDVRRINTLAELLGQLKGVNLELLTVEGPVRGLMMSVESRSLREGPTQFVTLLTDNGVKSIDLARVSSFDVLDERVAKDLRDALRTLAQRRAEDRADLTVSFGSGDDRTATLGYIHESPVWKTSYRLVLPDETGGKPFLQGWAIVENQTDEDWDDVRLSLVSGRPVAFTMDLRTPLFIARPEIAPPIPGAVMSRVYDDAVQRQMASALAAPSAPAMERDASAYTNQTFTNARRGFAKGAADEAAEVRERVAIGGTLAGQSTASGATSGEQFRYQIAETVDIGAKSNAMLPILAGDIAGSRVSIYNASDLAEHPMRGVEFTNTSGADLAAGPIVVYDGDSYAGDAQVGFTSRGQDRLLSYAVDQDVRALRDSGHTNRVTRIRIVDGVLERTQVATSTVTITFMNRDHANGRELLVEEPRMDNSWNLKSPVKPDSESETLLRFRLALDPGETVDFPVVHERVSRTTIALTDMELRDLFAYSSNGVASKQVIDAVRQAQTLRAEVRRIESVIRHFETEREQIGRNQARIRSNMGPIDRNSDLYARYMRALNEQEDRLNAIETELQQQRLAVRAAQEAFDNFLRNLSVE